MTLQDCKNYFANYKFLECSEKDIRFWDYRYKEYGYDIDKYITRLLHEMTCSRKSELYGFPIISTNSVRYNATIEEALYFISKTPVEEHNRLCQLLINQHEKNIVFEHDNPPPMYVKKKTKAKRESNKSSKPKEPKETSKAIKAKAAAIKLNLLSFKLKPTVQ